MKMPVQLYNIKESVRKKFFPRVVDVVPHISIKERKIFFNDNNFTSINNYLIDVKNLVVVGEYNIFSVPVVLENGQESKKKFYTLMDAQKFIFSHCKKWCY